MQYKYNEIDYAETIYRNGIQTKHIPTELMLLVLYYKEVLGLSEAERRTELEAFCEKHIVGYKKETYFKVLNRALNAGKKKNTNLIKVENIAVYQGEINYLNSLDIPYNHKKIMFTFLIQMKLNKYIYELKNGKPYNTMFFKGGKQKYGMIKKISNVPASTKINEDVIYELGKLNLVTILHKGLISLDYIQHCEKTGDVLMPKIHDYENIGLYFDYYNNENNIAVCKDCNAAYKKNSNSQIVCEKCAEYKPVGNVIKQCIECNSNFTVDARNTSKTRCDKCYKAYRLAEKAAMTAKYRKNN